MKLSKLCNLRCTYCYEYDELSHQEKMPIEKIEFFLKNLAQYILNQKETLPIEIIFHGGEALLLPHDYLRTICQLCDQYFTEQGIFHRTTVQSNLFKISNKTIDLLQELNIALGFSLDVFGDQRVDIAGRVSQEKVLSNLQRLLDRGIAVAGIVVLHALNVNHVEKIYQFYNELNINFRVLPIFNHQESPERMKHLLISHEEIVTALKKIAVAQLAASSKIDILPLKDYFEAAVRYLTGRKFPIYDPSQKEWALIINTNGDTYSHGDAYSPEGFMGNVFQQSLNEIFTSSAYANATKIRLERAATCRQCEFDQKCDQLHLVEAISSERSYDEVGKLQCMIAKPMIQFMVNEILRSPEAKALINVYAVQEQSQTHLIVS
ncbi:radical SAM protein [Aliinostoc sp. HNIBRCY26]|uniref:radical SAM protein n=1 Tax=Aliinostoc sp. HNIBRCY26 TaxID=3418997 RepID=UPI003D014C02